MPIDTAPTSGSDSVYPALRKALEHTPTIRCQTVVHKILIAEQDTALRGLIADVFDFEGYCVTEAADERALWEAMRIDENGSEGRFDLIIVGFQTGGRFNPDTLIRVRALGRGIPAIVLAEHIELPIDHRAHELDVAFLKKPFVLANLRIIANHVLRARQRKLNALD